MQYSLISQFGRGETQSKSETVRESEKDERWEKKKQKRKRWHTYINELFSLFFGVSKLRSYSIKSLEYTYTITQNMFEFSKMYVDHQNRIEDRSDLR